MRIRGLNPSIFRIWLSLCLVLAAGAANSTDARKWQQSSLEGKFMVELISTEPTIGLNEFHTWRLVIRDADSNQGVSPVRVVVGGGMEAHGHGLPTQPRVTEHLGDGEYQLEGLKFNMAGSWQLILDINTEDKADRVVFDLKKDN